MKSLKSKKLSKALVKITILNLLKLLLTKELMIDFSWTKNKTQVQVQLYPMVLYQNITNTFWSHKTLHAERLPVLNSSLSIITLSSHKTSSGMLLINNATITIIGQVLCVFQLLASMLINSPILSEKPSVKFQKVKSKTNSIIYD